MQNRKMMKRVLSLVMVALMLVGYIPSAVWAVDSTTDIKAIAKPTGISIVEDFDDYIGDTWLEELDLPQFVTVTLANDTTVDVPVTWDTSSLDTRTTGYYALPGTITLPNGATNGQNLSVAITVQVREIVNVIPNGDFENGKTSWKGWSLDALEDPANAANHILFAKKASMSTTSGGSQAIYQVDASIDALVQKFLTEGAGLYYFAIDAMSAPYDASTPARDDIKISLEMRTNTTASSSGAASPVSTAKTPVNAAEWTTLSQIVTLDNNVAWMRTEIKSNATAAEPGALYLDNFRLIPLKIALKSEPASIAEIKTEILSKKVIVNFPDYVEDWKTELGLPTSVEVLTDLGNTTSVDVTWSFAGLDFAKPGKYVLTGKLDDGSFPNPNNIVAVQNIYVSNATSIMPNGDFENGTFGWGGWSMDAVVDPLDAANHILFVKKASMSTSAGGSQAIYQKEKESENGVADLVAAFAAVGAGKYYFAADVMSAPYDENTPARTDIKVSLEMRANTTGTSSNALSPVSSGKTPISATEWTTLSAVVDMDAAWNWLRTELKSNATAAEPGALYIDNFRLIPICLTIPKDQEPADIVEIIDEMPVRAIVQNFDQYVTGNWQTALGLPTSVKVRTSNGTIASVDVNWDYSILNLKATGKYIVVGTLDNSAYPNPDNLVVQHVVHVREAKNMLTNPSFELGNTGWSFGSNSYTISTSKFKHGGSSALVTTAEKLATSTNNKVQLGFVYGKDESEQKALGERIAQQGAGMYYFSAWALYGGKDATGLSIFSGVNYKQTLEDSSMKVDSDRVALSTTQWVQSASVINIPADIQWARLDLNLGAPIGQLANHQIYLDHVELIPINVIVEQYEGAMQQVVSIIPDRQIVQNYPDYIGPGYTTADLMLPETVDVRTTTGEIVSVEVKWDYSKLDLTKTGTYVLHGALEELRLSNPDALVVKQTIKVAAAKNLFTNPSFENEDSGWKRHSNITLTANIMRPVHGGDYSMKYEVGRLESWTSDRIQSFYNNSPTIVGNKVLQTGAGRYAFGGWIHGTSSSNDVTILMSMKYKGLSTGDSALQKNTSKVQPSASKYVYVGDIVEIPDDVYWARMDMYIYGTPEQMRLSTLYLDDFQLIALNVEIPNLNNIVNCEGTADIYVHEGSSIAGLKLPETLQVVIKTGQKFDMRVKWDTSTFDPNKLGEQIIVGALDLEGKYKNPKLFTPEVRVIVRDKNAPLRDTIYISTSGSESNDGLSPENPKSDVTKINTYLKQGYNVKLKRGDTWYIPSGNITISSVYGTADAPLSVGAYGNGDEKPIIAYMKKIENNTWRLVDEKRNIYAVDVSSLGAKNGISVHRCFMDGVALTHKNRTNYISLSDGEYCSYDYTLYVRLPAGQTPENIEVTAYNAGHRLLINNVSHLTIENIHFKGASATSSMIYVEAPTSYLKFTHCDITHCAYFILYFDTDTSDLHYKTEISYCYIDANFNEAEGAVSDEVNGKSSHWDSSLTEGILFNNGANGAWIHHNTMRNMGHGFITLQGNGRSGNSDIAGCYNCVIEDNVLEGGNALYARAFNLAGGYTPIGVQVCRDNIVRRNRAYDMTTASHLFGENLLIYSNLMSYMHCSYKEDGTLFDGKNAQPFGWDTLIYSDKNSIGVMLINNTFYNVSGAIAINDNAHTVYNNIYANNLIINYTSDPGATLGASGAIWDRTIDMQYVMNNGVYSAQGVMGPFVVDDMPYSAEDVNVSVAGYSGNIYAEPKFVDADLTLMDKYVRQEFDLSSESPFRYTGLSLYNPIYQSFPAWQWLKDDYTDINGVVYLAESPSIGAYSYCERIKGDVVEVGTVADIYARPGAKFEQLNLPGAVSAVNERGIDVMLLATWSDANFDSSKTGTITLTAELRNGPHTDLNINGKTASINVIIHDKLEILNINTDLTGITVLYGTTYEGVLARLPQTLDVMAESGYREELPVTWTCDFYNPTKPDSYTFKCILPEDKVSNVRDFSVEMDVRLLHEIGRGTELLVNPDFIDGNSAGPWAIGWGTANFKVTTDPQYLMEGEPAAAIVTSRGKYASIQQDVTGQMKLMGDGKYLFKVYMRAYEEARPIDSSQPALKVFAPTTYSVLPRAQSNIGTEWVEFSSIMDVVDVDQATQILFHTSTHKSEEDVADTPKSYIIAGCSLVFLGTTDAEVEATLDSMELTWNFIKGENTSEKNVMTDLKLPTSIGSASKITWTSSDESAITSDGKVTLGRVEKEVILTANITYQGIESVKKFTVIVPRDPELPVYTGTLNGETDIKQGETFQVTISVNSENATAFNAYRFTLSFTTSKLEFMGISDPSSTVEIDNGRVTIFGIGTERPITDTITVTFKALKSGVTDVKLVKVEMDLSAEATLDNLPVMEVVDGTVTVNVEKTESAATQTDTDASKLDNTVVIWIVIGLVAAALIAGGAIVIILIKKKKQAPTDEN